MRHVRRTIHEPRLELTPLLDVVFLLLTFFIFALVLVVQLRTTEIRLPAVSLGAKVQRGSGIVVGLLQDGRLRVDEQTVEWSALAAAIEARRREVPDSVVLLAVDERTPSRDLFKLVDALQHAGITDLRFLRASGGPGGPGGPGGQAPAGSPVSPPPG